MLGSPILVIGQKVKKLSRTFLLIKNHPKAVLAVYTFVLRKLLACRNHPRPGQEVYTCLACHKSSWGNAYQVHTFCPRIFVACQESTLQQVCTFYPKAFFGLLLGPHNVIHHYNLKWFYDILTCRCGVLNSQSSATIELTLYTL